MSAIVKIPTAIQRYSDGLAEVPAEGGTLRDVLEDVVSRYNGLQNIFFANDGELRNHVVVFVNDENVRESQGLNTPVPHNGEVLILPQAAGGVF